MGSEEPQEITTPYGNKIKRDIDVQDLTGSIPIHIFTNRLDEVQNNFDSYNNERIFWYCKKCKKEIPIADETSDRDSNC